VLAFSPGFMVHPQPVGKPKIFVTHGTRDQILWQRYGRGYFRYKPDTIGHTVAVWKTSAIPPRASRRWSSYRPLKTVGETCDIGSVV